MPTYTVVPTVTGPGQIQQGIINVSSGDVYIISPTVSGGITFNAPFGSPTLSYAIQINQPNTTSPSSIDYSISLGDGTSPSITVPPGVDASRYNFSGSSVDSANYTVGTGASIGSIQLGDGGDSATNVVTFGDNVTVDGGISGGAGNDIINTGINTTIKSAVDFGAGSLSATFGNNLTAVGISASGAGGRCCRTLAFEDSHRESMRLDGLHEQAITRPLSHDELVQLLSVAAQARVAADLAGQGDDLARAA